MDVKGTHGPPQSFEVYGEFRARSLPLQPGRLSAPSHNTACAFVSTPASLPRHTGRNCAFIFAVDDVLVHSKLETGAFPNYGRIVDALVAKREGAAAKAKPAGDDGSASASSTTGGRDEARSRGCAVM